MEVSKINFYNNKSYETKHGPAFKAKIFLNQVKTQNIQKTPIDALFNENSLVKRVNNFSLFVRHHFFRNEDTTNSLMKIFVKLRQKFVKSCRIIADRMFLLQNLKSINKINGLSKKQPAETKEYIEEFAKIGNSISDKFVIMNSEDKILEKIAKSDESTLFILNHPNFHKDKFVYAIINSFLNKLYVANNKQATCPRPKILVSKNMLNIVHPKVSNVYKHLGLTPIDTSKTKEAQHYNASIMRDTMQSFVENKSNLFFFPEGNNSVHVDKPLEERIQPGISRFIKQALTLKKNIRVVPIGIYYAKQKNNIGKIHIGNPIYFDNTRETNEYILQRVKNSLSEEVEKAKKS